MEAGTCQTLSSIESRWIIGCPGKGRGVVDAVLAAGGACHFSLMTHVHLPIIGLMTQACSD